MLNPSRFIKLLSVYFTKNSNKEKIMEFKFALGITVKDTITGFEGVVTRRTQWLNNCNTYGVQPRKLIEGKIQEPGNFDEPQLELVPEEKPLQENRKTGGPERAVRPTNR